MPLLKLRHLTEYFAVRVALSLIQAMSMESCAAAGRWLAWLAADVLRIRGKVVDENLRIAFSEMTEGERRKQVTRNEQHGNLQQSLTRD